MGSKLSGRAGGRFLRHQCRRIEGCGICTCGSRLQRGDRFGQESNGQKGGDASAVIRRRGGAYQVGRASNLWYQRPDKIPIFGSETANRDGGTSPLILASSVGWSRGPAAIDGQAGEDAYLSSVARPSPNTGVASPRKVGSGFNTLASQKSLLRAAISRTSLRAM